MNIFRGTSEVLSPASRGTRGSWGGSRSRNGGAEATFVEAPGRHARRWTRVAVSWWIEWTGVGRVLELHYVMVYRD